MIFLQLAAPDEFTHGLFLVIVLVFFDYMMEIPEQDDSLVMNIPGIFGQQSQHMITTTTNLISTPVIKSKSKQKKQKKAKLKPKKTTPKTPHQPKAGHNRQTRTIKRNGKFLQYISNKYSIFMMAGIVFVLLFFRILDILTQGKQKYDIQLHINNTEQYSGIPIAELGLIDFPQVGTQLDIFGIGESKEFAEFKQHYMQKYRYTLYRPHLRTQNNNNNNHPINNTPSVLTIQTQTYLCTQIIQQLPTLIPTNQKNTQLTSQLAYKTCHQLNQQQSLDIEHRYADIVYNVNMMVQQPAICVLSYGLQHYDVDRYRQFVESILQQEYTNYRVIVIDDCTTDKATPMNAIVQFFGNFDNFIVVRNRMRMGKLGSYYLHAKLCANSSIVVYLDANDLFVGAKTFDIIGSIFGNQDVWMLYPSFFVSKYHIEIGRTPQLPTKGLNYRAQLKQLNFPSLIAHRTQLIEKLPLEHFIEYHKNRKNPFWSPSFQRSKQINPLVYSLLELCGENHAKFIDHFMYMKRVEKDWVPQACQIQNTALTQSKSSVKIPMIPLTSLISNSSFSKNNTINPLLLEELQSNFNKYRTCIENSSHSKK